MSARYRIKDFKIALRDIEQPLAPRVAKLLNVPSSDLLQVQIIKKSIDARKKSRIVFILQVECELRQPLSGALPSQVTQVEASYFDIPKPEEFKKTLSAKNHLPIAIVGAGPAGLFAALALSEAGANVILLERGKPVETRMRDIGELRSQGVLDPESNICFGEGGAGTYTDGKLYTRIKHPYLRWVMQCLVDFGAPESILVDAHPHLGTDRLVDILKKIRQTLLSRDVEIRFQAKLNSLNLDQGVVKSIGLESGEEIQVSDVVLAVGHSARDTFEMLHEQGIRMEAKPFAVGFRAEHPQELINKSQYGSSALAKQLGAAAYALTHQCHIQKSTRGVYSFCMCPGGFIVPTPTESGCMVVNGMSNSNRSADFANSGIVVQVEPEDLLREGYADSPLMGIEFQRSLEAKAYHAAEDSYRAPAMKISDFLEEKLTPSLAPTNFRPGLVAHDLNELIPTWLKQPLHESLKAFDRKIKGYSSSEANLLGVESRSSSPLRITRGDDMMSVNTKGLYPVGEGAGYAGGIISAAVDGLKAAAAILEKMS